MQTVEDALEQATSAGVAHTHTFTFILNALRGIFPTHFA
jgi:hypothetical protein